MDIPVTIATVIAVRNGIAGGSPRPDGVQTFIFFGVPTSHDYGGVNECFSDMAIYREVDIDEVDKAVDTGYYGTNAYIEYDGGSISMLWEVRL